MMKKDVYCELCDLESGIEKGELRRIGVPKDGYWPSPLWTLGFSKVVPAQKTMEEKIMYDYEKME